MLYTNTRADLLTHSNCLRCLLTACYSSSSSRMRVMKHNWSATKQCLHPQSAAEVSRHSVLLWDRIRQCGTSSGSRHKDTDQCPIVAISFCRHRSVPVPCEFLLTSHSNYGPLFWDKARYWSKPWFFHTLPAFETPAEFHTKNILCGKTRMVVSTRMVKKFEDMSTDFDRIHKPGAGSVRRVELLFLA